jgi:phage shock protein A
MGFIKRLFNIGASEANSALDKLEDPVKLTEQAIRDMKGKMQTVITAQATSKAQLNKLKGRKAGFEETQKEFMKKANSIQDKIEKGGDKEALTTALKACLNKVQNAKDSSASLDSNIAKIKTGADKITKTVKDLKDTISEAETSLITLKARAESAKATKDINKQMSDVDVDGFQSTLQRMKDKVDSDEAESDAYAEINDENKSEEDIINDALSGDSATEDDDLMASFMSNRKEA